MLQAILYPTENFQTWSEEAGAAAYPGQEMKLWHCKWLFENYIMVVRNVLAAHIGMWDGDDESAAYQVVLATTYFVDRWYPAASPGCLMWQPAW